MKYLSTMMDNKIQKEYDLYSINAKELHRLLKETYSKKINEVDFHLFNSDLNYFEKLRHLKQLKRREAEGLLPSTHYKIDKLEKEVQDCIENIQKNAHHTFKLQTLNELGYELMPLAVSVKGRDIANIQEVELLDGFRRMFFTPEIPDVEVLVKVYDEVSDTEWINLMIVFNSWKFADRSKSELYMDRGFRLGLYYRYGVDFTEYWSNYTQFAWKYIDIFTGGLPYSAFWNNLYAHKDISLIYQLVEYRPVFKVVKKRSEEVYNCEFHMKGNINHFLEEIYTVIISKLGAIRKREFSVEVKGDKVTRKPFNMEVIKNYFEREDLQPHFMKLAKMSVPGFMDNYIRDYLKQDLEKYLEDNYFDRENSDTLIQQAKFIRDETTSQKEWFSTWKLNDHIKDGSTAVYRYLNTEFSVEKIQDKYVLTIDEKQHTFDTIEELAQTPILENGTMSLRDERLEYQIVLVMIV